MTSIRNQTALELLNDRETMLTEQDNQGTPTAQPVLEVSSIWNEQIDNVRMFPDERCEITIGDRFERPRFRWFDDGIDFIYSAFFLVTAPLAVREWLDKRIQATDFFVDGEGLPGDGCYTLVERTAQGWTINMPYGARGYVRTAGEPHRLDLPVPEKSADVLPTTLPPGAHAVVHINNITFLIREVRPPKPIPGAHRHEFDKLLTGILGLLLVASAVFFPWLATRPIPEEAVTVPAHLLLPTYARVELPKPEPATKPRPRADKQDAGIRDAVKGDPGTAGRPHARRRPVKGHPRANDRARSDRAIANEQGLLIALNESGVQFANPGAASNLDGALGNLMGTQYALGGGTGGFGSRGSGFGGGGTAERIGPYRPGGRGTGDRGTGPGAGYIGEKGTVTPEVVDTGAIVLDPIDKAAIDRVIKNHIQEIRYCYERQLSRDPTLAGKVTINWVIGTEGMVSSASVRATSLDNSMVESCLTERIIRMRFPKPRGSGIVRVSYPFVFRAAL